MYSRIVCVCKPAPLASFEHLQLSVLPYKFRRFVLEQCETGEPGVLDRCGKEPGLWYGAKALHSAFASWASRTGMASATAAEFAEVMGLRFCRQSYGSGLLRYVGIKLKRSAEDALLRYLARRRPPQPKRPGAASRPAAAPVAAQAVLRPPAAGPDEMVDAAPAAADRMDVEERRAAATVANQDS